MYFPHKTASNSYCPPSTDALRREDRIQYTMYYSPPTKRYSRFNISTLASTQATHISIFEYCGLVGVIGSNKAKYLFCLMHPCDAII